MVFDKLEFKPDHVSPPGETLLEMLKERKMTQRKLAELGSVSPKHINDIVKGRARISPVVAIAFETVLGAPAGFWLVRDAHYQEFKTREWLKRSKVKA